MDAAQTGQHEAVPTLVPGASARNTHHMMDGLCMCLCVRRVLQCRRCCWAHDLCTNDALPCAVLWQGMQCPFGRIR